MINTAATALLLASTLAASAASAALAQSPAPTPPEGLTWYVLDQINEFDFDVEDPGNRQNSVMTEVPDGVIQAVSVNDDGKPDWLVRWPEMFQFCGTGGCQTTLYVSGEDGLHRAFDRQALDFTVSTVGGETRVEAWVHHLNCVDEREECRYAWAWDDRSRTLVQRPASDGVTVLHGTGVQPIDDPWSVTQTALPSWPSALETIWRESRRVCLVDYNEGFEVHYAAIAATPDLNDDSRPDWVVTPAESCDSVEPGSAFQVWTTTGEGDRQDEVSLAYTAPAGAWKRLQLEPKARLEITTDCDRTGECAYRPLRWDAATGTLTE